MTLSVSVHIISFVKYFLLMLPFNLSPQNICKTYCWKVLVFDPHWCLKFYLYDIDSICITSALSIATLFRKPYYILTSILRIKHDISILSCPVYFWIRYNLRIRYILLHFYFFCPTDSIRNLNKNLNNKNSHPSCTCVLKK